MDFLENVDGRIGDQTAMCNVNPLLLLLLLLLVLLTHRTESSTKHSLRTM